MQQVYALYCIHPISRRPTLLQFWSAGVMEEAQLSEALSALVDSAVQRLISAGVGPSLEMEEELRLLRQTNEELLAALQVDEVELSRLHGVLCE